MGQGETGPAKGLFASLGRLAGTALEMAQVRLDLLGTELELEKERILSGLLFGMAALLVLGVGVVLCCGFVILLLWEGYRLPALGVMALFFVALGVHLLRAAQRRLRTPGGIFASSVAELARDRADLASPSQGPGK